jgi:hypothetical protein
MNKNKSLESLIRNITFVCGMDTHDRTIAGLFQHATNMRKQYYIYIYDDDNHRKVITLWTFGIGQLMESATK